MEESAGTFANVASCTQQLRQCSFSSVQDNNDIENVSGDLSFFISTLVRSLHACSSPDQTAHTLGALASALTSYDSEAESVGASDPIVIEHTLANQLKPPPLSFLVQELTIQALARLYGNSFLSAKLAHSEAKMMLVGLITMATNNDWDALVRPLLALCSSEGNLWCALQGRDGVQLLVSLLGLSSGPQQDYAVRLLGLLWNENDDSRQAISEALLDLLKPIPDRPRAPSLALGLLTELANGCPHNKVLMVESGALVALTEYLSFRPRDATEEAATDLLGLLFSTPRILAYRSALGVMSQLISILREGGRGAKCSAAKALKLLFLECPIRNDKAASQAVAPLAEILNTGLEEEEQHVAIAALVLLLADFPALAHYEAEVETISVDVLCRILSSSCSTELKRDAAELCSLIFRKYSISSTTEAACCVEPLVSLLVTEFGPCHLPAVEALDQLVDDVKLAEEVVTLGAVVSLVHLLKVKDFSLLVAICILLKKLGKKRPACREEMVRLGVVETVEEIYLEVPRNIGSKAFPKLLRLLTNNERGQKRDVPVCTYVDLPYMDWMLEASNQEKLMMPRLLDGRGPTPALQRRRRRRRTLPR